MNQPTFTTDSLGITSTYLRGWQASIFDRTATGRGYELRTYRFDERGEVSFHPTMEDAKDAALAFVTASPAWEPLPLVRAGAHPIRTLPRVRRAALTTDHHHRRTHQEETMRATDKQTSYIIDLWNQVNDGNAKYLSQTDLPLTQREKKGGMTKVEASGYIRDLLRRRDEM